MQILGTIALCVLLTLTSATSTDPDVLIADGMTFALRTQTLDGMETTRYVAQAEGPPVTTALSTRTTQNGDTTITDTVTLVRYMTGDELEDSSTSSAAAAISSAESSQISFLTPAATNSAEETEEDNDHSSTITLTSTYAEGSTATLTTAFTANAETTSTDFPSASSGSTVPSPTSTPVPRGSYHHIDVIAGSVVGSLVALVVAISLKYGYKRSIWAWMERHGWSIRSNAPDRWVLSWQSKNHGRNDARLEDGRAYPAAATIKTTQASQRELSNRASTSHQPYCESVSDRQSMSEINRFDHPDLGPESTSEQHFDHQQVSLTSDVARGSVSDDDNHGYGRRTIAPDQTPNRSNFIILGLSLQSTSQLDHQPGYSGRVSPENTPAVEMMQRLPATELEATSKPHELPAIIPHELDGEQAEKDGSETMKRRPTKVYETPNDIPGRSISPIAPTSTAPTTKSTSLTDTSWPLKYTQADSITSPVPAISSPSPTASSTHRQYPRPQYKMPDVSGYRSSSAQQISRTTSPPSTSNPMHELHFSEAKEPAKSTSQQPESLRPGVGAKAVTPLWTKQDRWDEDVPGW